MIGMKVFITILLAVNFIAPIEVVISKTEQRTRKIASCILFAIYAVGIMFTWII